MTDAKQPLESINQVPELLTTDDDLVKHNAPATSTQEQNKEDTTPIEQTTGSCISVKVQHGGKVLRVKLQTSDTLHSFKEQLAELTKIEVENQKLIAGGKQLTDDGKTVVEVGVKQGCVLRLVGTCTQDITDAKNAAHKAPQITAAAEAAAAPIKLCEREQHKKVISKGVPDYAWPGILNIHEGLPNEPLRGMSDKNGHEIRLSFKLEDDMIWIASKERTNKVPMNGVHGIISEPIVGFEHYHIMAIQLGPTEQSRVWFYWVPAQYIQAIKLVLR